jgi:UDP-N-acetylglucosamine diphosphorylase / glucose-1-phosphate thymidylyltransferase / UDP-N-acetylgalactosamine diphosphorylase / glucosamine-1-phosphate N-acetyltransferase / galactosamine-1-phosphate N-acetyltransferase
MTAIYLLEPNDPGQAWAPFAGAAPLSEMRAGAWLLHERWARGIHGKVRGIVAAHAAGPRPTGAIPLVAAETIVGPAWVVDATFAPKLPMRAVASNRRLLHAGRAVAWKLDPGQQWTGPFTEGDGVVIEGRPLRGAWELITALEQFLFSDTLGALDGSGDPIPEGTIVLGNRDAISLRGAVLEPGVVLDARQGGIILETGVQVKSGTRIDGPFWAREGTLLVGGTFRVVSVGPHCRLHGEISTSVFNGYANKSHDGFLGHSVVGEWVNLGAGTITSNLKNTYGPIRLDIGASRVETGRTNLGSLIGPHVKTAIGTLLPTGAVLGAGAQLFGSPRAPKFVPPLAWGGENDERVGVDGFLEMAKRVLPRRDVTVDAAMEASLRALHQRLTSA